MLLKWVNGFCLRSSWLEWMLSSCIYLTSRFWRYAKLICQVTGLYSSTFDIFVLIVYGQSLKRVEVSTKYKQNEYHSICIRMQIQTLWLICMRTILILDILCKIKANYLSSPCIKIEGKLAPLIIQMYISNLVKQITAILSSTF